MNRDEQTVKAELFRSPHRGPRLLVLPNAWGALSPAIDHPKAQFLLATKRDG
jgi:hypothetical protein